MSVGRICLRDVDLADAAECVPDAARRMPTIRRHLAPRVLAALALLLFARPAAATDVTDVLARMRRAIEPGRDMRASFELVMTNAQGERVRWGGQFYRLGGLQAKKRLVFDSPVDLRGVSVSVQRTDGARDRTRIYLPFVRRVREIESDMRGESFLGTDFNFEDLGLEELEFHEHALRGEEELHGRACWRVESVPDRSWWYGRIARCIDKKDYLPRLAQYYDPAGLLYKVRTFERVETIDGHPTPVDVLMEVIPGHTSSRLVLRDIEYDTGLQDELFVAP